MPRSLRALLLLLTAGALVLTGCDSDDTGGSDAAPATTVQFGTAELSALEADSPTLELPVTISNAPVGERVRVEVLYAAGASEGFSLADLGITDVNDENAFYNDDGALSGYVVGTLTFPAGAEDGATQVASFNIADDETEEEEVGVFALQRASGEGGAPVEVGDPASLTLTVQAEGTRTLLSEDFQGDSSLDDTPFFQFSVASGQNWGVDSFEGNSYAGVNGFNSGNGPASNDWLISDALDFASVADEVLLFRNAKNFDDGGFDGPALSVLVSTDYSGSGDPSGATWTEVSGRVANFSGGGFEYVSSGEVSLSDEEFQSEATYVAFQYESTGAGAGSSEEWQVDDVVITGQGAAGGENDGSGDGQ